MSDTVKPGDLFFFYGLLRKGAMGAPEHIDFEGCGVFLDDAFMRGDLFSLGGFPGIVDGDGLVTGVLYRLDDLAILPALDAFEDYFPEAPERSMYLRIVREVLSETGAGTGRNAWVYWYNRDITGCPKIETGLWPLTSGNRYGEGART